MYELFLPTHTWQMAHVKIQSKGVQLSPSCTELSLLCMDPSLLFCVMLFLKRFNQLKTSSVPLWGAWLVLYYVMSCYVLWKMHPDVCRA